MEKNSFKNKLNDVIFVVAHYFEILISIIVIGVILYLMCDLVQTVVSPYIVLKTASPAKALTPF